MSPAACPPAAASRPWQAPPQPTPSTTAAPEAETGTSSAVAGADYRHRLTPTPAGWPVRPSWCVWVEPVTSQGPAAIWEQRWGRAVSAALHTWQRQLPIQRVERPEQAQVLVQRRRPPIHNNRASHGRALLQLLEVQRDGHWQLEPQVEVLISPGQAEPAIQATALHELGHAFGLWGHSDQAGDAMAVSPGARPVLELSPRDRATLQWLQGQPGLRHSPQPGR
jgi:predicted Zn-dependent protease